MEPETESSTKFLSVGELRGLGILQEANRLLFHPLGLALEVDLEAGTLRIQDHRSDPEGVIYGEGVLDPGNTARFKCFQNKRHELREKTLGYVIQAVAGVPDGSATPD